LQTTISAVYVPVAVFDSPTAVDVKPTEATLVLALYMYPVEFIAPEVLDDEFKRVPLLFDA
jgi:hypothetical protein